MSDTFAHEINQQVAHLTPGQQQEVLVFVKSLGTKSDGHGADGHRATDASADKGTPGKELLKFAGSIPHEDLEAMKSAIEEGCGQVDPNGW